MGKWTPDYLDDVLHSKIKSLVSGAISRSSLEKADPTISYENFVKELDIGDSFTTSLIDILVKELAERRTRPNLNDRRLIADRSAKSLRSLATPLRVYRERSVGRFHSGRRTGTVNLTEYLTAPPNEMDMEEDEDIFERMLDNGTPIEGVRINSDLYEAYGSNWENSRGNASASPPPEEHSSTSTSHPPQSRSGPWSLPPAASVSLASSNLTRQSSIRRPVRSRTVDFNDFTHRRRSSIRESLGSRTDTNDSTEPREGSWNRTSQSTRRFFPFGRSRRFEATENLPWSDVTDSLSADALDDDRVLPIEPTVSSATWFSTMPTPQTLSSPQDLRDAETSDERAQAAAPRLRRGGLRAPESMLSRHASPIILTPLVDSRPSSPFREPSSHGPPGDASAYPTPGSTDNENLT